MHHLTALTVELHQLKCETGKTIRLGIEPEALCELETTPQTIVFFQQLLAFAAAAGAQSAVREHIGVCFDVCHQAVEFEDVAASIDALHRAGIRINKMHLSCAIRVEQPARNPAALQVLRQFVEPRYLHQTFCISANGRISATLDLDHALLQSPPPDFASAAEWRVHFHVPIDAATLGLLATTQPQLQSAMAAIAALPYAPHLEVETYTWSVLPNRSIAEVVDGMTRELVAAGRMIDAIEASIIPPAR